jgi:hypothetical protein
MAEMALAFCDSQRLQEKSRLFGFVMGILADTALLR